MWADAGGGARYLIYANNLGAVVSANTTAIAGLQDSVADLSDLPTTVAAAVAQVDTLQTAVDDLSDDITAPVQDIGGLTLVNDDLLQVKSGHITQRTISQVKSDLSLTKTDVGLGSVDNTSDASKPISTATQTALDGKAPAIVYNGSPAGTAKIYVQSSDPGSVADGSVWFDTSA